MQIDVRTKGLVRVHVCACVAADKAVAVRGGVDGYERFVRAHCVRYRARTVPPLP